MPQPRPPEVSPLQIRFHAVAEDQPGPRWRELFQRTWPHYEAWFLKEGEGRRPGYVECRMMLRRHMPELEGIWYRLVELAGGGDRAARLLSLYRPTPYLSGCSQAVWTGGDAPMLVRNYDYHPESCEGTILRSHWNKRVLAQSDCLWGVLDGVNEDGLCVSLAFGGRRIVGDGFGIPLILRYALETCATTLEAVRVLERVPSHMAYNVTVVDASGTFKTVFVAPDHEAYVTDLAVATNHQEEVTWKRYAEATQTELREEVLLEETRRVDGSQETFVERFLEPPLFHTKYRQAFGTLYTAAYLPQERAVRFVWPKKTWEQSLDDFDEAEMLVRYRQEPDPIPGSENFRAAEPREPA